MTLLALRTPAAAWMRGLLVLRYTTSDGRTIELPVQGVADDGGYIVAAAHGDAKTWWRHFRRPAAVRVRVAGRERAGIGRVLDGPEADGPARRYRAALPRAGGALERDGYARMVRIDVAD